MTVVVRLGSKLTVFGSEFPEMIWPKACLSQRTVELRFGFYFLCNNLIRHKKNISENWWCGFDGRCLRSVSARRYRISVDETPQVFDQINTDSELIWSCIIRSVWWHFSSQFSETWGLHCRILHVILMFKFIFTYKNQFYWMAGKKMEKFTKEKLNSRAVHLSKYLHQN